MFVIHYQSVSFMALLAQMKQSSPHKVSIDVMVKKKGIENVQQ